MSKSSIPRFLLPQLTWKSSLPRTYALVPQTRPSHPIWSSPSRSSCRPITSIAQPCYDHDGRLQSPWISALQSSRGQKSSTVPRGPNPLRAAYRICSQKPFSTTSYLFRDHHFDTLKFVQRLKDEGFSEEQSKAMMLVLSDVIEESIQNLTRTMVLREGTLSPLRIHTTCLSLFFGIDTIVLQTPTAARIPKKSTSPNSALSS